MFPVGNEEPITTLIAASIESPTLLYLPVAVALPALVNVGVYDCQSVIGAPY